jgi:uncharacterized membrane protein
VLDLQAFIQQNIVWFWFGSTIGMVIGIKILEYTYHLDLLKANDIEEKRKNKKKQRILHRVSIVCLFLVAMGWGIAILPTIEWWQFALIMGIMIIFPLADCYTTFKIIGNNYNKEMNPIGKYIMNKWGKRGTYIQVISMWILISGILCLAGLANTRPLLNYLLLVVTIYAGVFLSNYQAYYMMKKYPDLYWYTEWYDGKKVIGDSPK